MELIIPNSKKLLQVAFELKLMSNTGRKGHWRSICVCTLERSRNILKWNTQFDILLYADWKLVSVKFCLSKKNLFRRNIFRRRLWRGKWQKFFYDMRIYLLSRKSGGECGTRIFWVWHCTIRFVCLLYRLKSCSESLVSGSGLGTNYIIG